MSWPTIRAGPAARHILYFTTPALWSCWPFLPLIRRCRGCDELGLMYDLRGTGGPTGFSSTVFACNLFDLPATESEFLQLPREVYDSAEEVYAAGWRVD
jgi:hypothetical protein